MEGFYRPRERLKGDPKYSRIVTSSKSNVGIACFSETCEDILMWAHYAGNHTGMCLSYSTQALREGLSKQVSFSQKKYNWAYEREWRVLGPIGEAKTHAQAIEAIYFGSRVNLKHRQRILAKIHGTGIRAYMMEVNGYTHGWRPANAVAKGDGASKGRG